MGGCGMAAITLVPPKTICAICHQVRASGEGVRLSLYVTWRSYVGPGGFTDPRQGVMWLCGRHKKKYEGNVAWQP